MYNISIIYIQYTFTAGSVDIFTPGGRRLCITGANSPPRFLANFPTSEGGLTFSLF